MRRRPSHGYQEDREAAFLLQPAEEPEDFALDGDVERGGRFVSDQQPWLAGKREGDRDALRHPAGQLERSQAADAGGVRQVDLLEQLERPGSSGGDPTCR